MRDIRDQRAARRDLWLLRGKDVLDAELLHEPALFGNGIVGASRHGAGVSHGARELAFPASDHARDNRFGEVRVEFVIAARLRVKHGSLAARIVGKCEGEFGRGEMDIDVLAA